MQVELLLEAQGASLSSTINSATSTLAEIKTIATEYCRDNKAKKGDCKESVEVTMASFRLKSSQLNPNIIKSEEKTLSRVI